MDSETFQKKVETVLDEQLAPLREAAINTMAEYASLAGALTGSIAKRVAVEHGPQAGIQCLHSLAGKLTLDLSKSWPDQALDRAQENVDLFGLSEAQRAIFAALDLGGDEGV